MPIPSTVRRPQPDERVSAGNKRRPLPGGESASSASRGVAAKEPRANYRPPYAVHWPSVA